MNNTTNFVGGSNWGIQIGQYLENYNTTINHYNGEFDDNRKYVQSLLSEYRRQKDVNPNRAPRTCQWFLQDRKFKTWYNAVNAHLLHVFANPGCGKSVLARSLIDEHLVGNNEKIPTLYFFFKRGQGNRQDRAASAIAAMLHQLYSAFPKSTQYATSAYRTCGDRLSTMFEELWDIFIQTCAALDRVVVCVVDALDECDEADRALLISKVEKFYSYIGPNVLPKLKMIITSRPYGRTMLYRHLRGDKYNFIRFDGDEKSDMIAAEIDMVIEEMVPAHLFGVPNSIQTAIIQHLKTMDNRTYLWLSLSLEYVERNIDFHGTEEDIIDLLQHLPPEVDQAYEDMLNRSTQPEIARKLLLIILAARNPMTINEQFERDLRQVCGLLLVIREGRIYFIHQSAMDFLLAKDGEILAQGSQWKQSFNVGVAHSLLAEVCITYISLQEREPPTLDQSMSFGKLFEMRPFLLYAAKCWAKHYRDGGGQLRLKVQERLWTTLRSMQKGFSLWTTLYGGTHLECVSLTPLNFAVAYGLNDLVQQLLSQGVDPNETDRVWGSPLHAVCVKQDERTACSLLHHGASIWSKSHSGMTALRYIALCGWTRLIETILNIIAEQHSEEPIDGEILVQIAGSKNAEALRLILDHPAAVQPSRDQCVRSIQAANMSPANIQYLLESHQIIQVIGREAYAVALLAAAEGDPEVAVLQHILEKYHNEIDRQTYLHAIEVAYETSRETARGELLIQFARNHFDSGHLVRNVDVRYEMRKAATSGNPFMLQLLLDCGLVEETVKSEFYSYILRTSVSGLRNAASARPTAISNRHVATISLLLNCCPPSIKLQEDLVSEAENAQAEHLLAVKRSLGAVKDETFGPWHS